MTRTQGSGQDAETSSRKLAGVIPIPVTSFDEVGRLDLAGMAAQVEFSIDAGCDGLLYPGVVSEFYTLTDQERRSAVETVMAATAGRVPVAVGVTGASTQASVEFTRHAAELGATAVMTMVPYVQHFFGPDHDFVVRHYDAVASLGLPVVLQNARVGFPLGLPAMEHVIDTVDGVRYVKEESNPPTHGIGRVERDLGKKLDGVFGGIGGVHLVNELERGASGTMPSPAFVDRIVSAYRSYRENGAVAAQQELDVLGTLFVREVLYNVVFHKEVLRRRGVIGSTTVRIASPALDQVDLADLDRLMAAAEIALTMRHDILDYAGAGVPVRNRRELMVLRSPDLPRHALVRTALEQEINAGMLRPGDQVPTEPQLMERFQVSRTTVRRALRDLEMRGLISREAGRGTFVREPHVEPRLDRLSGFVEDMEALGLRAHATVELIERAPAPADVSDALGLRTGATAVHIQRVRLANDVPISFDDSWFPEEEGNRVAKENLEDEPFYSILENKYGIALAGADYVVRAMAATAQIAAHLQIPAGAPILHLTRVTKQKPDRRPLLFEHLYYAGHRTSYQLTVDR